MTHFSRWTNRLTVLMAVFVIGGCSSFDPQGDSPYEAPAVYRTWWSKTQACSGKAASFDKIKWNVVEGNSFPCKSGQCVGHWESNGNIYIASEWVDNEMVVRHEMLHALLDKPGHPNPPFGADCPLTWETWRGGVAGLKIQQID